VEEWGLLSLAVIAIMILNGLFRQEFSKLKWPRLLAAMPLQKNAQKPSDFPLSLNVEEGHQLLLSELNGWG